MTLVSELNGEKLVVTQQIQGPAGPKGDPGPALPAGTPSYTAAAGLTAYRVVALQPDGRVVHADNQNMAHIDSVLGILQTSPVADTIAPVQREHEITNPGWSWAPGDLLFLGTDGVLITAPPTAPAVFSLAVAFATASDKVIVDIGEPIVLGD